MRPRLSRLLLGVALVGFAAVLVRTAWLSDDAYITLRTLDNFRHGYGLRWNVDERVQGYTHPLWMLLLLVVTSVTREHFYTTHLVSLALSLAAVALLAFKVARSEARGAFLVLVLSLSKSFVSFSSSGLENPLTHLLVVATLLVWLRLEPTDERAALRRIAALSLLGGLALLNRMDSALVVGPPLLFALAQHRRGRAVACALVGAVPVVAWELFSLVYYGALVPNTAYAKLATGIPAPQLAAQSVHYFIALVLWDPIAAATIVVGLVVPIALPSSGRRLAPLAIGVALHLLYVVKIGGDFMAGRFFALPLLVAVVLVGELPFERRLARVALALPALGLYSSVGTTWRWWGGEKPNYWSHGVADERVFYYASTGLVAKRPSDPRQSYLPNFGIKMRERGARVVVEPCIGMVGYYAGPTVHIVDNYGLTEPLIARLPIANLHNWRIGHFPRNVPDGYLPTLERGKNVLRDADLARWWDDMHLVLDGPLFAPSRLRAIARMVTGQDDALIGAYIERHPPV